MENLREYGALHHNNSDLYCDPVWCYFPTAVIVPPLALPTNAMTIWLLLSQPGVFSTAGIFTIQLAIFDMLFCFIVLAEYIQFLCIQKLQASNFIAWSFNQVGGPVILCLLSLDCYMAVCHPLVYLRLKDPRLRLSLCFAVNVVTAACCPLMKFYRVFKWSVITGLVIIALVITSTCNIRMLSSLRQTGPSREAVHPVKKRAFKIVLSSFILINVHYLPNVIEYFLRTYLSQWFRPLSVLQCLCMTLLSIKCVVQPLCYLAWNKKLRKMICSCGSTVGTQSA